MDRKNFSDTQMSTITSCGTYGLYFFGPMSGFITDKFGPRISNLMAAVFSFMGYYLLSVAVRGDFGPAGNDYVILAVFYTLVGIGCSCGYSSGLGTLVKNAPAKHVGLLSGLGVGFFGISGLVFTSIKRGLFYYSSTLQDFFLTVAIIIATLDIMCLPFMQVVKQEEHAVKKESNEPEQIQTAATVDMTAQEAANNQPLDLTKIEAFTSSEAPEKPRVAFSSADENGPNNKQILPPDNNNQNRTNKPQLPPSPDIQGWPFLKHPRFWYLFCNMLIITGNGMMFVLKVGTVIQALSKGNLQVQNDNATLNTFILAAGNFTGRLSAGVMTDFARRNYGISRVYFMSIAGFVMSLGCGILIKAEDFGVVILCTILISFCHGLTFAITSALISDWFTRSQYAFKWYISI
jgi:MFS family permease